MKILNTLVILTILFFSCVKETKESDLKTQTSNNGPTKKTSSVVEVASVTSTSPLVYNLNLNSLQVTSLLNSYCSGEGLTNPSVSSYYISDNDFTDQNYTAYFIIEGSAFNPSPNSTVYLTIGVKLEKDNINDVYRYNGGGGLGAWACTGSNCSSCKPIRDDWRGLWQVTGCECVSSTDGNCNHTTSGEGLGGLIGTLVDILL